MEGSCRGRAVLSLLAFAAMFAAVYSCAAPESESGEQAPQIPAPPFAFADSVSPVQYLAYADSLSFAIADSTSAITRHGPPGERSVLRVSPEVRLRTTADTAYNVGRIIARVQTDSGVSPFNTPVGEGYLWVWRAADGTVRSAIITREPSLPTGGRILSVPTFYHIPLPDTILPGPMCLPLPHSADSLAPAFCCRCGGGCWNPWAAPMTLEGATAIVRGVVG